MITKRRTARSGQALVEFALVMPVLLILIIGIFEVGRAWSIYQVLTDTSRSAARTAVMADAGISDSTYVYDQIQQSLSAAGLDTSVVDLRLVLRDDTGSPDSVVISYPYEFTILGKLLEWTTSRSEVSLTAQSVMRNE